MTRPLGSSDPVIIGLSEDPAYYFHRLYVQFLQGLFNWLPPKTFKWEPDPDNTEIVIRGEAPIDAVALAKRPAITVTLGPYSDSTIGLNNMLSYNMVTGRRVHTVPTSGFYVVYVLANSSTVASKLAELVKNYTHINHALLSGYGGFTSIGHPSISINSPSPPGALVRGEISASLVMVQVNVPFMYQWAYSTAPGRAAPQDRSIAMITQKERASEYPYTAPAELRKLDLAINALPPLVRQIDGQHAARPTTVQVGDEINPIFETTLIDTSEDSP